MMTEFLKLKQELEDIKKTTKTREKTVETKEKNLSGKEKEEKKKPSKHVESDSSSESDSEEKIKKEKKEQEKYKKLLEKIEKSKTLEAEKKKKEYLKKEFEDMMEKTTIIKTESKAELKELENKLIKLELSKKRIDLVFKELEKAEKVDICFMVDCTGSMRSYINEAKSVIHKIVNKLKGQFQDFALRFAFVGYRDHGDGAGRVTVFPFSDNADSFKSFVNGVEAKGGADECEDIFGGLEESFKQDWQHMSRILFHIGDAPCHGRRFYIDANDDHPSGDPRGLRIEDLMKKVSDLNLAYYFAEINDRTQKMIEEFNLELAKYNGMSIKVVSLKTAADLATTVAKSITTTILESKSKSMNPDRGKRLKPKTLDKKLSWNKETMEKYDAELFEAIYDFDMGDLKKLKHRNHI